MLLHKWYKRQPIHLRPGKEYSKRDLHNTFPYFMWASTGYESVTANLGDCSVYTVSEYEY